MLVMDYRREIDGLRAVAMMPVVFFHAGFDAFSGGFVGVDVFFVISGYLITSILVEELSQEHFSIVRFHERRARRILPALFFVMLCCMPFAWFWMIPDSLLEFGNSLGAVSLFVSNFLFWQEIGYFAAAAEEKPLLHTWSLAVEEQYYLLYPLLLAVVWHWKRQWLVATLVVGAVGSLILADLGTRYRPDAAFYLAPFRAWELLVGSLVAYWLHGRRLNFEVRSGAQRQGPSHWCSRSWCMTVKPRFRACMHCCRCWVQHWSYTAQRRPPRWEDCLAFHSSLASD